MNNVYKEPSIQRMNVYNDLKEISKEAREEFQEYNRQGPQYILGDYNTALTTLFACRGKTKGLSLKSYQEWKNSARIQPLKEENECLDFNK